MPIIDRRSTQFKKEPTLNLPAPTANRIVPDPISPHGPGPNPARILTMPRVCEITGKKTSYGRSLRYRGKAKYLGGVGKKITGKTKRRFRPNIQTVTALIDGQPRRMKVSTKALRAGLVIKPLKRKYAYHSEPTAE